MAKYKLKHTSIMHNGNLYTEGDTVELTDSQAKRLEDFVTKIAEKKSQSTQTPKKGTKQEDKGDNNDNNK